MQQLVAMEHCGSESSGAHRFCRHPWTRMSLQGGLSKRAKSGFDLISLPLGGKTQAAGPFLIRFKAASGPEPVVGFDDAKIKVSSSIGEYLLQSGEFP